MSGPDQLRHRGGGASNNTNFDLRSKMMIQDTIHDNDDNESIASNLSNGSAGRRYKQQQTRDRGESLEHIDEEHGISNYELNRSLLRSDSGEKKGSLSNKKNKKLKHKLSTLSIDNGNNHNNNNNSRDTPNKQDHRSKALFFKTAFWITCWYSTSLATLFLNKIILSKPNSSVHVLGMCQMTTAAVLGGWSTFGGLNYIQNLCMKVYRCLVPGVAMITHDGSEMLNSSSPTKKEQNGTPSKPTETTTSGVSFHFVRDMSIVGILRGLTVVLGLVALEHVPVSFVETIKSTAPAFTVIFAKLILKERTATPVMMTLLPIIAGLILCSASELSFDTIGFVAAVSNNCADCVQESPCWYCFELTTSFELPLPLFN